MEKFDYIYNYYLNFKHPTDNRKCNKAMFGNAIQLILFQTGKSLQDLYLFVKSKENIIQI